MALLCQFGISEAFVTMDACEQPKVGSDWGMVLLHALASSLRSWFQMYLQEVANATAPRVPIIPNSRASLASMHARFCDVMLLHIATDQLSTSPACWRLRFRLLQRLQHIWKSGSCMYLSA